MRLCHFAPCFVFALSLAASLAGAAAEEPKANNQPIDFARDIRPILSDACFKCHGPDESTREADLRLDTREGALAALDLQHPPASSILERMNSTDADVVMPPPATGKVVTPAQRKLIARWIAQGANWSTHWAFTPPQRPAVPDVHLSSWVRNPIDAFILHKLEQEKLSPAPQADRATLLRRLSLDLTGLPPTLEELDRFLNDESPEAYEHQVDRLLKSPHYGERWGRLWLDAARYADSDGYEKDKPRFVYFYRDWVVNAFNRDLPYNQFLIEQIAGDLLPNPTQDQLVATGYLRNSMINEEGGIDPEQFRMEAMFDRMDAVGKGVLGLTVGCAQCHTHKFDPLTHTDYYRMFACLNNAWEASVAVYSPEEQRQRADLFQKMAQIEEDLQHRHPDWQERLAQWAQEVPAPTASWQILRPELDTSGGEKHDVQEDGSILASGYAPTKSTLQFTAPSNLPQITAVRLELLNDPNLPRGGPGRSLYGLCALTEFRVTVAPADHPEQKQDVKIISVTADVNPPETELQPIFHDKSKKRRVTGPATFAIDGKQETAWGIDIGPGRSNVPRQAVFVFEKPISFPAGTIVTCHITQNHGGWNSNDNQSNNLGRFRLSATDATAPEADQIPPAVRKILAIAPEQWTENQTKTLFTFWRTTVPEWAEANAQLEALWKQHPAGDSQMVLLERDELRMTSRLDRGDFLKPQETVTPGVPEFLNPPPSGEKMDRLAFARWLTAEDAPTTGRALVNRVWQTYFGIGFVSTPEDLGLQSETPYHRELFDWLTVEFQEHDWKLKHLHRLIVTSATYRQSSKVAPEAYARDPENRLLARGSRFRMEAEIVRDIALAASGLLNPEIGGAPVYPPAPAFLFQAPASYGEKNWPESTGPDRYRRALYTFRFRSVPYPMLQTFDAPNGDAACVRRTRSNTPLQALTSLNEPLFVECARALALNTLQSQTNSDDNQKMDHAFRRCTSRLPNEQERAVLTELLTTQRAHFAQEGVNPLDLLSDDETGQPVLPETVTPVELAVWTVVSRVILNLDETMNRE